MWKINTKDKCTHKFKQGHVYRENMFEGSTRKRERKRE
jgi:hypothetical protein